MAKSKVIKYRNIIFKERLLMVNEEGIVLLSTDEGLTWGYCIFTAEFLKSSPHLFDELKIK
jgi:hypothetical protein